MSVPFGRRAERGARDVRLRWLADAVRSRRVGSHELVAESLRRIEELDPDLGAVVALRPQALDDARVLDASILEGEDPGPLAGLPLLVKDITDVAGMRTTFGSVAFAGAPPAARDATVVARLRTAGAVVVGKTNTPEFAAAGYTTNLLFGPTRNPWDRDRNPGGSSGGSAAALAAGLAPIATATDGGGSIRIPACYCGLAGLKPTNGVIGRDPIPNWLDLSTDGPFSAHADDLALLLDVLRGPVAGDPTALPAWAGRPPAAPTTLRVVAVDRLWDDAPLPDAAAVPFARAVARFAEVFGVDVERPALDDPYPDASMGWDWFLVCACEHAHHLGRGVDRGAPRRAHRGSGLLPRLRVGCERGGLPQRPAPAVRLRAVPRRSPRGGRPPADTGDGGRRLPGRGPGTASASRAGT